MTEGVWIALIMAGFGLFGSIINGIMIYRSKKLGNNPYPCREHETRIEGLHTKIGKVDEKLDKACERISKVEGRLNGLK